MKITPGEGSFRMDVKRCYLPFVLEDVCPKCAAKVERDLALDYLSYPVINSETVVDFYCDDCSTEWMRPILLKVTLELPK